DTITVAQLLMPYPEFGNITYSRTSGGSSYYNSVQIGMNKRFSHGLNMQFAYTLSKQLEKLRYIEPSDAAPSQMTGQFDNPQRVPAINNWDMAFLKNTTVWRERAKLQFRLEMINAFNRVWFGGLNTTVTAPTYTQLTTQANQPRNIQLGLKLSF